MIYPQLSRLRAFCVPVLQQCRYKQCRYMSAKAHSVLVSTSANIYENLALETCLFEKADLEKQSLLLMWRNAPAVVCGRHQNPWLECNIPMALKLNVDVARRNSGGGNVFHDEGNLNCSFLMHSSLFNRKRNLPAQTLMSGTVFHDEGNLNCSFLMHSSLYNRKRNLQLAVDAIKAKWPDTKLEINRREDIILNGHYKISGTASKLSSNRTYHHFTLLFDVDRERLDSILSTNVEGAASRATESVKGRVSNLGEHLLNVDYNSLVSVISDRFLQNSTEKPVQYIDPMDGSLFPGVDDIYNQLTSWDWIYGRTPEFSVSRQFHKAIGNVDNNVEIHLLVKNGTIHDMDVNVHQLMGVERAALTSLKLALEETRLERVAVMQTLSQVKMAWIYHRHYSVDTREVLDWTLLCVLETLLQFTGRGTVNNYSVTKKADNV